jgi:hypothetical protein
MTKQTSKGKVWGWIAGVLLILLIAGYAGWHFLKKNLANPKNTAAKAAITDQLKKLVTEASDSLYHIEYDRFEVNIDAGKGLITNFKLLPDSAVYQRLLAARKAPNDVIRVVTDSLILDQFGFAKTPEGRRFNIASLTMKHPQIRIVNKRLSYNDTVNAEKAAHPPALVKMMKDFLKITSIQKMNINNLNFTFVNQNESKEKITSLKHLNILMDNFTCDKLADAKDTSKKTLFAKVKLCRISTPDSLYRLNFRNIYFSPEQRNMLVKEVSLVPRLEKVAFYKAAKYDKDRIHLVYNNMAMRNIDIKHFLQRQEIHIGSAIVGSSWGEVFNNYNWPKRTPPVRTRPFPHQMLQQLAFDITIDTMKMHKGYFKYEIAAKASEEKATLFMTQMEGTFYNITNNTAVKRRNPYTLASMRTKMMGAGDTYVNYKFNLASKNGAFSTTVKMGPMDGTALNPLAKPLAMMAIQSAQINKMLMHIDATDRQAKGNIDFYYKNMKVALLKRDDKNDNLKKRGLLSFFTNAFMPNDNPKKNGKFRKGPINVTRGPRESFFGLLYKCSMDGMSSAMMGFDQHKQKPNENIVIKALQKKNH